MGLYHDYIVMNSSKGFFCLPEVILMHFMYITRGCTLFINLYMGELEAQFSSWLDGASKVR